jgi:hypothetical protein
VTEPLASPRALDRFERQLLRRLVFDPDRLSRNRNFYAFHDPAMRRLRRLAGLLRGLRSELAAADPGCVDVHVDSAGFVVIRIERRDAMARRETRVAPDELEVLREDADVGACIDAALSRRSAVSARDEIYTSRGGTDSS